MHMEQAKIWEKVDQYIEEKLIPHDSVLESVLAENRKAGLPAIDVSPTQGKLLHVLAKMHGSKRILEIGTLGGYSTIWMARALPPEGKLITIEREERHAEVAKANIKRASLQELVEVRVGGRIGTTGTNEGRENWPFRLDFY